MRQPPFTPMKNLGISTHFHYRLIRLQDHSGAGRIRIFDKILYVLIAVRSHDNY
jgi:hypothetical protein